MKLVLTYGFGFAALLIVRFIFGAPMWLAGLIGLAVSYLAPRGVLGLLSLGMKVSRSFIERSPDGRALMAEHDAEQAEARKEWESIQRRRAAGEPVDEIEADRIKGILFRNEGIAGNRRSTRPAPPRSLVAPTPPRTLVAPIKVSTDGGKRGPEWMLSNVGHELAIHFRPRPADPMWKLITTENAPAYQLCFQQILLRAGLLNLYSSNQIDDDIATKMGEAMEEVARPHNLNSALLLILAHQYVDADQMMRMLHTTTWVAKMVERDNFAPSPESYLQYVKERFFAQSVSR